MSEDLMDEKCYELAGHFLPAHATDIHKRSLGCAIQTAVEDWFEEEANEMAARAARP